MFLKNIDEICESGNALPFPPPQRNSLPHPHPQIQNQNTFLDFLWLLMKKQKVGDISNVAFSLEQFLVVANTTFFVNSSWCTSNRCTLQSYIHCVFYCYTACTSIYTGWTQYVQCTLYNYQLNQNAVFVAHVKTTLWFLLLHCTSSSTYTGCTLYK